MSAQEAILRNEKEGLACPPRIGGWGGVKLCTPFLDERTFGLAEEHLPGGQRPKGDLLARSLVQHLAGRSLHREYGEVLVDGFLIEACRGQPREGTCHLVVLPWLMLDLISILRKLESLPVYPGVRAHVLERRQQGTVGASDH